MGCVGGAVRCGGDLVPLRIGRVARCERYYLVRRGHSTHFGGTWGIPGGALDPGESPWEAARRETLEEIGYAVSSGEAPCYEDALATDWSYWTFVVTVEDPFVGRFNWELSEEGWFTVDEIAAMNVLPALAAAFPGLALLGRESAVPS